MPRPQTIQIFLPDGSARSIKIAEITSKIVKAIQIPRNKIKTAEQREETSNAGVYFLFGESEETAKSKVYIGEAENCIKRIKQHLKREFWNVAILIISKTESLTKSHVKFLENHCVNQAKDIGRYEVENASNPTKSHITEQMEADIMDLFDDMKILLSTLGFPIFESLRRDIDKKGELICKGRDAIAYGEYTDDGLVVFKGSIANKEESATAGSWIIGMREKLLNSNILAKKGNVLEFISDHIFNSPSAAAGAVLARRANGWLEWKNNDGKTLDELERKEES
ncbi:hypothetical protein ES705_18564 [subsurface metagenome]